MLLFIDLSNKVEIDRELMKNQAITYRVVGKRRTRAIIKRWIDSNWKVDCIIKFLPKNFFTIVFALEEDRNKVLQGGVWMIDGSPFYIQIWVSNFNMLLCSSYKSPIGIRLYNFPIKYWNDECLDKIGHSLGMLLEVDEDISDGDLYVFARMKIAAIRKVPKKVCFCVNGRPWLQDIEVKENNLSYLKCRCRNHCEKDCKLGIQNNTRWTYKKNVSTEKTNTILSVKMVMEDGKGKEV
ncbi:hypothetical protein SUGI_1132030 [Cryptomeria japonica]|nr:hypothetical protein SUGI_1132030 [Cryptomeria japonica]